jgi:hypothetical protein
LASIPEPAVPPFIYDVEVSALLDPASPEYLKACETLAPSLLHFEEGRIAIRRTDGSWHEISDGQRLSDLRPGPNGRIAAFSTGELVNLVDLESATVQMLSIRAYPESFSLDGSRLLIREILERDGVQHPVVVPVDEPVRAAHVPLSSDAGYFGGETRWLDATKLLVLTSEPVMLQVFETSGPEPELIAEHAVPSGQVSLSRDSARLAVQTGDAFSESSAISVYQLEPFTEIGGLAGAFLDDQIPGEIWSPDSQRILVLLGICTPEERLASINVQGSDVITLAEGGFMRFVFSPDGRWVSFTTFPRNGWVVPADGSVQPVLVSDNVAAPATPLWSPDSRFVRFPVFGGGYDRCV